MFAATIEAMLDVRRAIFVDYGRALLAPVLIRGRALG
jgi:hypothetical protein